MPYHHTCFIPDGANHPTAAMGGDRGDIPVINLDGETACVVVQLSPHRLDDAEAYLARLATAVSTLHGQVQRRRRQLNELLTAVEEA